MFDGASGGFQASRKARELFGFPADAEITLERFLGTVLPAHRARIRGTVQHLMEAGGEVDTQYPIARPDGSVRWIHSRGRSYPDPAGRPARVFGASVDVTDRALAEASRASQMRFERLLADLSARLVRISGGEVAGEIERALQEIGTFWDADRCALLSVRADRQFVHVEHAWYAEGLERVSGEINLIELFPWQYERLVLVGEPVAVTRIADTPPEAERDRQTWVAMGVRSVLTVPLAAREGIPWLLTINALREERHWEPELVPRLRLLGEVLLGALERTRAENLLRGAYAEVERLKQQLELENLYLRQENESRQGIGRIVGESPAMAAVLALVEQVAPTRSTVLIEGETGTGKELVANRIHELSPRSHRAMVKVNCAALPSTLVESELFGREKGAFTGAVSREAGRFEVADGSTLFLDEVAELPFELQSKLLRVLEEGRFERVGSARTLQTDVRVIAATNRDLAAEVEAGRFRRDLYFRLSVFPIRLPSLRERRGDVPLLVWSAVADFSSAMQKSIESIPREDMQRLERYEWPGNVRELRNVVERAMILGSGPVLRLEPPAGRSPAERAILSLDEAQRRQIAKALEAAGGRVSGPGGAAETLGIKPTTLRSRMERLGLDPRRGRGHRPPA